MTWKSFVNSLDERTAEEILSDAKEDWGFIIESFSEENKPSRENLAGIYGESVYQAILNPHFFFPYFFVSQFFLIEKIFKEFDLILPALPKTRDYKARLNYYFELCEVLFYFRQQHKIKPAEFLAFLYGFVGNFIKEKLEENEKPLRVWVLRGNQNIYDSLVKMSNQIALCDQSNSEIQKGDLILYYFWSPISSFKIVCRAFSNGFFDPFSYWNFSNLVSDVYEIPKVSFEELAKHEYFQNHKMVKARMGKASSKEYLLNGQDYLEFKKILLSKNAGLDILPELESVAIETNLDLRNERDVEILLLEPLLKNLGFKESDWIRQLPVRMGRGERNYPDYALLVNTKNKHEETAKFLWEAKYRIRNQKELRDTFLQAKSYARRLNSQAFGLVSVEGIWISSIKDNFEFEKLQNFGSLDIKNPEKWVQIKHFFK